MADIDPRLDAAYRASIKAAYIRLGMAEIYADRIAATTPDDGGIAAIKLSDIRAAILAFLDASMTASAGMGKAGENVMCDEPLCDCEPRDIWRAMAGRLRKEIAPNQE